MYVFPNLKNQVEARSENIFSGHSLIIYASHSTCYEHISFNLMAILNKYIELDDYIYR